MRWLVILTAAAFITVSPWLVRNYAVFHRVSFTSNAGVNFWMGNHAGASGAYSFPKENNPLAAVADDFDRSDLGFKLGFEFIRTHPLESAVTEVRGEKIAHFFAADYWLLVTMEYRPEWASAKNASAVFARLSIVDILVLHLPYAAVLLLGTFGLICPARKDEEKFFFLCALLVYWLAVHLVFYARRSLPVSDNTHSYSCGCGTAGLSCAKTLFNGQKFGCSHSHSFVSSLSAAGLAKFLPFGPKRLPTSPLLNVFSQKASKVSDLRAPTSNASRQKLVDIVAPLEYIYSSTFDFLSKKGRKLSGKPKKGCLLIAIII